MTRNSFLQGVWGFRLNFFWLKNFNLAGFGLIPPGFGYHLGPAANRPNPPLHPPPLRDSTLFQPTGWTLPQEPLRTPLPRKISFSIRKTAVFIPVAFFHFFTLHLLMAFVALPTFAKRSPSPSLPLLPSVSPSPSPSPSVWYPPEPSVSPSRCMQSTGFHVAAKSTLFSLPRLLPPSSDSVSLW